MRRAREAGESGFTLVEVMVACLILLIGIGALLKVSASSGHSNSTAERNQQGVSLAQQEIEKIRSLSYGSVGMSSTTYPASTGTGDPVTRLSGTNFTPANLSAEALISGSDCSSTCAVAPYSTTTLGSGSHQVTAKIYRFVSWRGESCASSLASGSSQLLTDVSNSRISLTTLMNSLVGANSDSKTTRSLYGLIAAATLAGQNMDSVLGSLTGIVNSLLSTAQDAANTIKSYATSDSLGIKSPVQALLDAITGSGGLTTHLTALSALSTIDLCKIDLSAIRKLRSVKTALGTATTSLTSVKNAIAGVEDQLVAASNASGYTCVLGIGNLCLVGGITSGLNNLLNVLNPIKTALTNTTTGVPNLKTLVQNAKTDVTNLDTTIDSAVSGLNVVSGNKQTKRVTVAVVLSSAGNAAGPKQPIWMTTVITDPSAGILQG